MSLGVNVSTMTDSRPSHNLNHRVALEASPRSLGNDGQGKDEARKRRCLTRSAGAVEMDSRRVRSFASDSGVTGSCGAVC